MLPRKTKSRPIDPIAGFEQRVAMFAADMTAWAPYRSNPQGRVLQADARDGGHIPDGWADLLITSPPYANNYDYGDATRLEMTFLREIESWSDLQDRVRQELVRACTQQVGGSIEEADAALVDEPMAPIARELRDVYARLQEEREHHAGKKNYHAMVVLYFNDMARVWQAIRRVVRKGGTVCFVIGDSAPYGIHVPVDRWMSELALACGFRSCRFEKIRDRNTKWKNRKHRVPLREGRLWVEG